MVKSGSFQIGQGSLAGRLGSGLGRGLGEQIPKEIERSRLQQGLQEVGETENMTPFQQFAKLSGVPGITPQMLQSAAELLRQQGIRQGIKNIAGKGERQSQATDTPISPEENIKARTLISEGKMTPDILSRMTNQPEVASKTEREPQITQQNPLREEAVPRKPWDQNRMYEEVDRIFNEIPGITINEAMQQAAQNEQRYLSAPAAYQAQDNYLREQRNLADKELDRQLQLKLQKEGKDVFQDITGEYKNGLQRSMYKDLRSNPDKTIEDVANYWSNQALNLSKAKSQINNLANKDIFDQLFKGNERRNKLEAYQKIFKDTDNLEEYYNLLRSDFSMTPQGAATIAFPLSSNMKKYMSKVNPYPTDPRASAIKYATDLTDNITKDDSILAIANHLRNKDSRFDERSFFQELRENMDNFSPRQKLEISEGEAPILRSWGDFTLLPWGGPR